VTIEVGYCESIEIGDATAGDRQAANRPTPAAAAAAAAAAALLVHADDKTFSRACTARVNDEQRISASAHR